MNIININQSCLITGAGNTKISNCYNRLGIPRGFIIGQVGVPITATNVAAFLAAMQALTLETQPYQRAYPVSGVTLVAPAGGDPVTFTEQATGRQIITANNDQSVTFDWIEGGMCLQLALEKFKGKTVGLMIYDHLNQIWATQSDTPDSVEFAPAYTWVNPFGFQTQASEVTKHSVFFSYNSEYFNKNLALIDFSQSGGLRAIQSIEGLQDVVITQGAARALGVFKVRAAIKCGNIDLHADYAADLEDATGWAAINLDTNKPIAITSVADDTVNGGWTVTLNTSDPNYTATANKVGISLGTPTAVKALTGLGLESNILPQ